MKILYHHRTASKDGQAVHIEELTSALARLGHEVIVVGPASTAKASFGTESSIVATFRRGLPAAALEFLELAYNFLAYYHLKRAYQKHQPDAIYERYNLFCLAGLWLKRRYNLPMLLEVNAPLYTERSEFGGLALKRLAKWCEETVWRGADYVLPVTEVLARFVQEAGISRDKISVVPNAINPDRFRELADKEATRQSLGLKDKTVLGFAGFLREWHGLDRIIDLLAHALSDLPVHLLIVGDGPARGALQSQITRLGVAENVTFTGLVARHEMAKYIAAFDIALQPAVRPYASPLKLFEYMIMRCAIMAPDTPNIRETLSHGESALLFDPDNSRSLCDAIRHLCGDEGLRHQLGNGARRAILDKGFTWENNARRVESLITGLVRNRNGHLTGR